MKRTLKVSTLILAGIVGIMSSCKKKSDDPTPDTNPEAKVFESKMTATNMGSQGDAIVVGTVSTSDGVAKLRLNVTHSGANNLSKIYIMKSMDNSAFMPVAYTGNITTADGKTFTGSSSDYTFDVPGSTKSFILDVPVNVRNAATAQSTDVYQIWITDGNGGFTKPGKNRVLGPATITLKYSDAASSSTYATATVTLGDQDAVPGSLLVTSGQVAAHKTADYNDSPGSSDLALCALDATGTVKTNGSGILWLVSPSLRGSLGYANEPSGANVSYIEASAADFDAATAASLGGLVVSNSSQKVQIAAGGVYKFQTANGKKGLIRVNSISPASGAVSKTAEITVKVQN